MKKCNYRQGDVFLWKRSKAPKDLKPVKDGVVARGEATGHCHKLFDGELLADEKGRLWIKSDGSTELRHVNGTGSVAEHETVVVEEGVYEVGIQRQYEPDGWRQVRD